MRKILFILLFIPTICFSQSHFKKGIRIYHERTEPQTLFTIRIDDGLDNTYTDWLPLLDSLDIVGAAAVHPDSIGKTGYMTWDQVTALQDSGWEILSHGSGGVDWNYITDSAIESQCQKSKDTLIAHGITINNIVPPLYSGNSLIGREISRKYYRGAGTGYTVGVRHDFNYPVIDQFNICAMRGDIASNYLATRANGVDSVIAAIDRALLDETWGVYFLHGYTIAKAIGLREIVEYVQDSGISIVTYNQALDILEPYITSGREFSVGERGVRISHAYGDGLVIDDDITKLGIGAGHDNDGTYNVAIGNYANYEGIGYWRVDIGERAGYNSSGNANINIGRRAGYESDVGGVVNIGNFAGHQSTGGNSTFGGYESGSGNSGSYSTSWGNQTAKNNSGTRGTFFGNAAGEGNSGSYAMGLGEWACRNNTKNYLFEIKQENANGTPLLKGFFDDRSFISGAPTSAIGDAEIDTNSVHMYLDEGNDKLMFRVRYSDGSLATGEVDLTPDP